ncbi:unnamed protein product [Sphenostylis stenocarpa]|uniref:Uncharacterized protein n=1 Tax=Sphenostylis stenocarpa TaxID=92480 RepID=A0AA86TP15_9FABA|nr:unnamed protein product [Sphenostylis stenocarpa]
MYDPMNQIVPAEDNDAAASDHHIHYSSHTIEDVGAAVEDVSADSVFVPPPEISIQDSSQLTLSFRGQVYVFDAVTPDKVQAVLLLLGGSELTSGPQCAELSPQNHTGAAEFPARCSLPQRAASLNRFRQKRKERCFDKKVRYSVRQEVALRSESDIIDPVDVSKVVNSGQMTAIALLQSGASLLPNAGIRVFCCNGAECHKIALVSIAAAMLSVAAILINNAALVFSVVVIPIHILPLSIFVPVMHRNKGQFTSSKKQDGTNSWGSDQESGQEAVQSETSCTHCGTSSKSTPMMRRGPSGPRSLCNACGLFWANRGTLRDLSKRNQEHSLAPPEQVDVGNNDLDCRSAIPAQHNNHVNETKALDE